MNLDFPRKYQLRVDLSIVLELFLNTVLVNSFFQGPDFIVLWSVLDPHGAVWLPCCLSDEGLSAPDKEKKDPSFLPVTGFPLLPAPAWDKCRHCYWLGFISVLGDRRGQWSCCHVPMNHLASCSGSSRSELLTLPGTEPLGITLSHILGEKAMATHPSTLAWKIPWTEEPGGLQSMGSLRVRHDWAISLSLFTFLRWRRKWQPTPVFLPGESQGWGSLVGCCLWGHTELDMTEET